MWSGPWCGGWSRRDRARGGPGKEALRARAGVALGNGPGDRCEKCLGSHLWLVGEVDISNLS